MKSKLLWKCQRETFAQMRGFRLTLYGLHMLSLDRPLFCSSRIPAQLNFMFDMTAAAATPTWPTSLASPVPARRKSFLLFLSLSFRQFFPIYARNFNAISIGFARQHFGFWIRISISSQSRIYQTMTIFWLKRLRFAWELIN